jgi:hypothetical protein
MEVDLILVVTRFVEDILYMLNDLLDFKLRHFGETNDFIERFDCPQKVIGVRSDPIQLLIA